MFAKNVCGRNPLISKSTMDNLIWRLARKGERRDQLFPLTIGVSFGYNIGGVSNFHQPLVWNCFKLQNLYESERGITYTGYHNKFKQVPIKQSMAP
jgi:hypothetical protein